MKVDIRRIGILTGGGDAPGLNAVIRAVTKTAAHFGYGVVGFEDGFGGLLQGRARVLTPRDVVGILPKGGTILGTTNRDNPFHYPVEDDGQTVYKDASDLAMANIAREGVDVLIVVGGDGSLTIARDFYQKKGLPVIGVPKTIDNDLAATDQTFGFDTALTTAMEALDKLHTTAESHHRVMVLEVMGRYAGWIALAAGLAGGADVILIPEIPFDIEKVREKVLARKADGKHFSIIVVAEGARPRGGEMVVKRVVRESFDQIRLGGIGEVVGEQVERLTGMETRVTVLGHLQRGGSPTAFDRLLATRLGAAAVELAAAGRFGQMVCLKGGAVASVPLAEAVGGMRAVPLDGDLIRTARYLGLCLGD
ncbi:MAG: ATP-dependent 6-phosphofructokinase [Thermoanaerobacterales bacterium]|nr:ATP-dependent 6-phosphofructokinase [Thermoanaerobacterales bacterium]